MIISVSIFCGSLSRVHVFIVQTGSIIHSGPNVRAANLMAKVMTYIAFWQQGRDSLIVALLGRLEQFDPEQKKLPQYVERLEQIFEANDITEEDKAAKHHATFHSVIGPALYKLM